MARKPWGATALAAILLSFLLFPLFFVIDRLMVFQTVPRDDYAGYLLWLVGQPGAVVPDSPYGYRLLTIVAAAPFYYLLPGLNFTNLPPSLSPTYVQATAAFAALSYLSTVGAGVITYRVATDLAGLSRIESVAAGAFVFLCCWYGAFYAIDSFTIFLIAAGLLLINRPLWFGLFIVSSIGFNEKIVIVFAIWLALRCVLDGSERGRFLPALLWTLAGIAAYVGLLRLLRLPGNEYQLRVLAYADTLLENVAAYFTPRGLLLNLIPVVALATAVFLSWRACPKGIGDGLFRRSDILVIPAMAFVALILTQLYQGGRIVAHAAPLFAVPIGAALGGWLRRGERGPASSGVFSEPGSLPRTSQKHAMVE